MEKITKNIKYNEKIIKNEFANCSDLVMRSFNIAHLKSRQCSIVYLDGLCDGMFIAENVIEKLINLSAISVILAGSGNISKLLTQSSITAGGVRIGKNFDEIFDCISFGDCALLVNGMQGFIAISCKKPAKRSISQSDSKRNVRGPKDAFNESLRDNTVLIRSKILNRDLKIMDKTIGSVSNTHVAVCYIQGIVNEDILERILYSLDSVELKSALASGFIQNVIERRKNTFFTQMEATERTDDVCSALLQGRVVIIVDGTPFAIILPGLFKSMLSSSEDFYESDYKRIFFHILRFASLIFTLLLPAMYIAIVDYNPDFVSDRIVSFIMDYRRQVPFNAFWEIMLLEIFFEIILEASLRLPSNISFTVGIVGTIILGQALSEAHIVNLMVNIIVSITAILVFVIPNYSMSLSIRLLKFVFMFAAMLGGFFGIFIASVICAVILCDMNTYGIEYLYPYVDSEIGLKNVQIKE